MKFANGPLNWAISPASTSTKKKNAGFLLVIPVGPTFIDIKWLW